MTDEDTREEGGDEPQTEVQDEGAELPVRGNDEEPAGRTGEAEWHGTTSPQSFHTTLDSSRDTLTHERSLRTKNPIPPAVNPSGNDVYEDDDDDDDDDDGEGRGRRRRGRERSRSPIRKSVVEPTEGNEGPPTSSAPAADGQAGAPGGDAQEQLAQMAAYTQQAQAVMAYNAAIMQQMQQGGMMGAGGMMHMGGGGRGGYGGRGGHMGTYGRGGGMMGHGGMGGMWGGRGYGRPYNPANDFKPGDWSCPQCGAHNFASRQACFSCQGPRPMGVPMAGGGAGAVQQHGGGYGVGGVGYGGAMYGGRGGGMRGMGAPNFKPGDWICTGCSYHNFASRFQCFKCNTPRPSTAATAGGMPGGGGGGGAGAPMARHGGGAYKM